MLSDADYKVMKEQLGIVFDKSQYGSDVYKRLGGLANKGLLHREFTKTEYSAGLPLPADPMFTITPSGCDALTEYEAHQKAKISDEKKQKFDSYWNRGLAILALIISIIALIKQ